MEWVQKAQLQKAQLQKAQLQKAQLQKAHMTKGPTWQKAQLQKAQITKGLMQQKAQSYKRPKLQKVQSDKKPKTLFPQQAKWSKKMRSFFPLKNLQIWMRKLCTFSWINDHGGGQVNTIQQKAAHFGGPSWVWVQREEWS